MMAWEDVSSFPFTLRNNMLTELDGFFDAGMLFHALKGLNAERERSVDRTVKRRFVGKKLHLNDY